MPAQKIVMKNALKESKKKWSRFHVWELNQNARPSFRKTFRLMGEWVDFFLLKHPAKFNQFLDVRGIQKLRRRLSCLSETK